jgi:hypothetical protein
MAGCDHLYGYDTFCLHCGEEFEVELQRLRAALDRVRRLHTSKITWGNPPSEYCEGCGDEWPCPTRRAID